MQRRKVSIITTAALVIFTAAAWAETYSLDRAHTSVQFRIRHLFTTVTGRFEAYDGKIVYDAKAPDKAKVEGSIDVASINTGVGKRDDHLRSPDFFDVAQYPKITFESGEVADIDAVKKSGKMHGTLTMHGVSRPIVLDVSFLGSGKDPRGQMRAGFHAETKINRKDFGLVWNKVLDGGGLLIGDEVTIEIDVEAVQEG